MRGAGRFPNAIDRRVIFGAACWVLSIVFFAGQVIGQVASSRPYSLATNLISDLGNTTCGRDICSPLHGVVNASFFLAGVLHLLGALTIYRAWPPPWANRVGAWLVAPAGICLCGAAVFPENVAPNIHGTFAVVGLVTLDLAMLGFASALYRRVRWLGITSYAAGIIGFIGLGALLNRGPDAAKLPIGLAERVADYPAVVMLIVLGLYVLASGLDM